MVPEHLSIQKETGCLRTNRKQALSGHKEDMRECEKRLNDLDSDRKYAEKFACRFEKELIGYTPKLSDYPQDTNRLTNEIENCTDKLNRAERNTKNYLNRELEPFREKHSSFAGTPDGILSVIDNKNITGDRYFTLYERTEGDIKRYREQIIQLNILLKDVEDSRKQLVTNCLQRVGRLYENLTLLSKKSTIQVGNTKKQMIRIELPEIEPLREQPAERIDRYIAEQVKEYLSEKEKTGRPHRIFSN